MNRERTGLPELLAPAGSMDSLVAAVNAGADAVYIGGKRFGARKYSANFTDQELSRAVSYAHLRGTRIYVTVNTLVHDRELLDVARYLNDLYAMGADAVLIQDPGVAQIARDVVPDLPRHASTQCTVTSREGVIHAKRSGFDRVVLAREVSLPEIDKIFLLPSEKRPGIEIFIHGALCYAYSGQCLLSSVIGGRSGNRGACAQPCRRNYSLVAGQADCNGRIAMPRTVPLEEPCLLSTKDLCLYPHLAKILERPLSALKIEGRMRSPEYVAVVVSIYRKAIDAVAGGSFVPQQSDIGDLAIVFSRGFTSGYLCGDKGPALMGRDRPDNRGLFIGTARSCRGEEISVAAKNGRIPSAGDGLVWFDPIHHTESGFVLRDTPERAAGNYRIRSPAGCTPGMDLYLTRSVFLGQRVATIRNAPGPAGRFPVPIDITLTIRPGRPPVLAGSVKMLGGDPLTIAIEADFIPEPAEGRPTTDQEITRQIGKSGSTAFRVRDLTIRYQGGLFLPVGKLNRFRRRFFDEVEKAFLSRFLPPEPKREAADCRLESLLQVLSRRGSRKYRDPELAVFCNEIGVVTAACQSGCDRIYFEPDPEQMEGELLQAITGCRGEGVRFAWKWPRVQVPEFTSRALSLLPGLVSSGLLEVMIEGAMYADSIRAIAPCIRVSGGPDLNIFNACTVRTLLPDCAGFTLSPELAGEDIADLCSRLDDTPGIGVIVQGNIPAMITADALLDVAGKNICQKKILYAISDATGRIFPVHPDPWGRTQILNAAELCLIDYLPALARVGVETFIIDARWRGPSYASEMISLYLEALEEKQWIKGEFPSSPTIPGLKGRIRALAQGGITAGHYLRGLSPE